MFCTICGEKLNDGAQFCHQCGTKVKNMTDTQEREGIGKNDYNPPYNGENTYANHQQMEYAHNIYENNKIAEAKKVKKKHKIKRIVIILALFVLFAGAGAFAAIWYFSPIQDINRALNNNDIEAVQTIYSEYKNEIKEEDIVDTLTKKVDSIWEDFQNSRKEYSIVTAELQSIKNLRVDKLNDAVDQCLENIEQLNDSRIAYESANTYMAEKNYVNAMIQYRLVIESDPDYESAVNKLGEALSLYKAEIENAVTESLETGNYENAISILQDALVAIPNDTELTSRLSLVKTSYNEKIKKDALSNAVNYADNREWSNAIKVLKEAIDRVGNDFELLNAYDSYVQVYIEDIINQSEELVLNKEYGNALALLDKAYKEYPDYSELSDKMEEIENRKPVLLSELTPINGGLGWNDGTPTDTFGNTYSTTLNYDIWNGEVEYRLYGEYSTFSFAIAPYKDLPEEERVAGHIHIWADDQILFSSPNITRKTDYAEYSLDVTGVEYLKISITGGYTKIWGENACIILMDCTLEKE